MRYMSLRAVAGIGFILVSLVYLLGVYWSLSPNALDIRREAMQAAQANNETPVVGYTTTTALIRVAETLLDKPGGFLSNDVLPPGVLLDDMPAWEFGALEMVRDLALGMRKDFSRSQSQSLEDPQLKVAQPLFNISHKDWAWPSAEGEYRKGIEALYVYRSHLASQTQMDAQFYARADNLRDWLKEVEKRLGSMSQRLSASVGQERLDTSLSGENTARQSTPAPGKAVVKTSWWKIDDVFFEARGASWALLHFLKAVEVDFEDVLRKKNALVSLRQIIRELEVTQETVWSPVILNGNGFGFVANHSLVMANYISRANAALIDLSELLAQG